MFDRADALGHTEPEHYLSPSRQWGRFDATKPILQWDTGGHLSRRMLEHYSHIRIDAKRQALDALDVRRGSKGLPTCKVTEPQP